jgi:exosome complex component RRP40
MGRSLTERLVANPQRATKDFPFLFPAAGGGVGAGRAVWARGTLLLGSKQPCTNPAPVPVPVLEAAAAVPSACEREGGLPISAMSVGTSASGALLPLIDQPVFPGDELCPLTAFPDGIVLGIGVVRDANDLHACCAGILRWDPAVKKMWVDGEGRRYLPASGDHVIGVIDSKHPEEYRLHINGAACASLPVLAFDGATRRNRPHLEVGALVYARIVLAHRDMEPEASCAAPPGVGAKDWVTRESVFGELQGGHVFSCPAPLCRRLLGTDECPVLDALGALAPFELAVGVNGRVWISSSSAAMVVLAQASLLRSQGIADEEHAALVNSLAQAFDLSPED